MCVGVCGCVGVWVFASRLRIWRDSRKACPPPPPVHWWVTLGVPMWLLCTMEVGG